MLFGIQLKNRLFVVQLASDGRKDGRTDTSAHLNNLRTKKPPPAFPKLINLSPPPKKQRLILFPRTILNPMTTHLSMIAALSLRVNCQDLSSIKKKHEAYHKTDKAL